MESAPDQSGGCIRRSRNSSRLGHDLWIVSERVDLVDLFVDVTHARLGETGAVLFRMFYETFEKFDDAVQTVHASLRISGTRQVMAFVGVADIFNGPIENLQATVQKL